jgi:hypothetical protein
MGKGFSRAHHHVNGHAGLCPSYIGILFLRNHLKPLLHRNCGWLSPLFPCPAGVGLLCRATKAVLAVLILLMGRSGVRLRSIFEIKSPAWLIKDSLILVSDL